MQSLDPTGDTEHRGHVPAVGGIWATGGATGTTPYEIEFNTKHLTLDATTINGNATSGIEVDSGNTLVFDGGGNTSSNEYLSLGAVQSWIINGTLNFQNFGSGSSLAMTLSDGLTIEGSGTTNIPDKINGTGALTIDGTGVVSLAGSGTTDTYTGQLSIESGTLQVNAANNQSGNGELGASSNTNPIIMGGSGTTGTLEYTGTSNEGSNRSINLAASGIGAVKVDISGVTLTLNGAISGGGSLSMNGGGNLLLSGATYTYTGGTTVNSGTLIIANSSGSATGTGNVTMNGGVLASSGTTAAISGNVVDGGTSAYTIAPGGIGTVGTLTLAGLTTTLLGTLNFDLGTGSGTITNGDLLVLGSGTVSIGSGTVMTFGGTPVAGDDYQLIGDQSDGSVVGAIPLSNFTLPAASAGLSYSLADNSGYIDLDVTTSGPPNVTWNDAFANNLWDTTSSNWTNGSSNTTYSDGSNVTFNDSNGGNYSVTLTTTVSPASVTVSSSGNYSITGGGAIVATGGFTKTGSSTLTLGAGLTASSIAINEGSVVIASNTSAGTWTVAQPNSNIEISSLTIAANSTLDITNNHLIIDYGGSDPMATIYGYLKTGFNNGTWNGTTGIISSTAQTPTNGLHYGIGFADGNDGTHAVAGVTSGEIELKYTLLGDANLDGTVNGSDFSILAANFGLGATDWDQGNFLYGSSVNGSDFSALAANFGQGDSGAAVSVSQADIMALDAFAIANGLALPTNVPEPASLGLLTLGGMGVLRRRRRRIETESVKA